MFTKMLIFIGGMVLGSYITKNEIRKEADKERIEKLETKIENKDKTESE